MQFHIKNVFSVSTAFALSFLIIFSCNKKAETAETEDHHGEKGVVELTPAQVKAAQIIFGDFEKKNLSEVITTNGYTQLPPQSQADVSVFMSGIVKTITVIEGQYVKKGQTIATFQSMEFNNLRLEKAKLMEELQQAKVNKEFLDLDFARQKELSDENVTAKKTFQKVSSELDLVNNKIKITQQQIEILEQNLLLNGNGNAATILITAPISGYITAINVKIGSNISANTSLFSIVDNSAMYVELLVYEKDLYKIQVGQNLRFVLTNQGNKEIIGNIFSIGKAFQKQTKSVAIRANINNKTIGLIPGMYVNALVDIGNSDVNTLPAEAIVKAEGKEFIFIREAEEKHEHSTSEKNHEEDTGVHFKRIEVKTGTSQLGYIQVTPLETIPTGAKIVIKGAYYLQSSIANAEGGDEHGH
ncbi:efflux RND transporter periplasmic adaptor subunit [Runella sp. MFBS21]|uniref:efflux RND transporter periplasmic adaptor subunit n=1 Tax=Runella sp. MFBS21 TaxID=3034018 RepID=UPI0023F62EA7|nr:efflux RND transporter periplasmic adaptor subunit [Runella sp. MFBS21]MCA0233136.1 efflux RND transporter periplasmic adaptor subunit [Bacteroidota bacterium]MDF7821259.1 efflux RND transporter periplasmic adaptor subunit [Runella sp. MFBS21]